MKKGNLIIIILTGILYEKAVRHFLLKLATFVLRPNRIVLNVCNFAYKRL